MLGHQKDEVEITERRAQLQISKRNSSRRDVMKMMVAGGGLLCLGEGNALAAAGEVEGPAQAAKNPLIQRMQHSLSLYWVLLKNFQLNFGVAYPL